MNDIMSDRVFGAGHETCRFTGLPLEAGKGALSPEQQAVSNFGKLQYQLAELKNREREAADRLAAERSNLATAHVAHNAIAADDITGRQNSLYRLARHDQVVADCRKQCAALAVEREALAVKVAEVGARLTEEGVIERHGMAPANTWLAMARDRGWSD